MNTMINEIYNELGLDQPALMTHALHSPIPTVSIRAYFILLAMSRLRGFPLGFKLWQPRISTIFQSTI